MKVNEKVSSLIVNNLHKILAVGGVLGTAYLYIEDTYLKNTKYYIDSNKLPDSFDGFKIMQISDFHNTRIGSLSEQILKSIRRERPNIIVITGDFIDSNRLKLWVSIDLISRIKRYAPIYYVTGNHEYCVPDSYEILKSELLKSNVIVLENSVDELYKNGEHIDIVGVNDPRIFNAKAVDTAELFQRQLDCIKYDKDSYTILLAHHPELFLTYFNNKVDLAITGHAHGGQIRIPFVGGLYSPGQGIFPRYTSGLHKIENKGVETQMVVSRGIGNSKFPFRVNNRPELVTIVLRKADGSSVVSPN